MRQLQEVSMSAKVRRVSIMVGGTAAGVDDDIEKGKDAADNDSGH